MKRDRDIASNHGENFKNWSLRLSSAKWRFKTFDTRSLASTERHAHHWRRLVKNIGWENQNIGGKVVKNDKYMGVSQLLGARSGLPPKSTPMTPIHVLRTQRREG